MTTAPPGAAWLHRRARALSLLALLGMTMPLLSRTVAGLPTLGWVVDLATHWQWLCVPAALIAALPAWRGRVRLAALVLWLAGLASLWWVMPPLARPSPAANGAPTLRLITANVHLDNAAPDTLLDWARARRADVILLQETSPDYAAAVDRQAADFPYRWWLPRDDPFGLGIVSRLPLGAVTLLPGADGIPALRAVLETPTGGVPLIIVHPFPPLSAAAHQHRNQLIAGLDAQAATTPELVIAGDFNASPWSAAFAGVRHLAIASDALPSWRGVLPIDHVLVGRAWARTAAERGPAGDSDHRPLLVELLRQP